MLSAKGAVVNEHHLAGISLVTAGRSRSVSPENPTGEKGRGGAATVGTGASAARDLGPGWKVSPSIDVPAGSTAILADLRGPGVIRHVWLTTHQAHWRSLVLRAYWDDAASPAIAVPLGDFFCQGWDEYAQVSSQPIAVNPNGGLNSYWEMPYRTAARIELENVGLGGAVVYFQIDYELMDVDDSAGYLHARWRRSNPLPYREVHTVLDAVSDRGHYVGTYLACQHQQLLHSQGMTAKVIERQKRGGCSPDRGRIRRSVQSDTVAKVQAISAELAGHTTVF